MARCSICGFPKNSGVHLPAISGPRKGKPWGHEFVAIADSNHLKPNLQTNPDEGTASGGDVSGTGENP